MGTKSGQVPETAQQKALADHSVTLLQDYRQRWLPVQQKLASRIEQEGAPGSDARKIAAGKASTDTAMAFDQAGKGLEESLSNAGVNPGSARANLAIAGMGTSAAASTGLGRMMSDQAIDDAYTQGLSSLTALGRGEKANVGTVMAEEAQQSGITAQTNANIAAMKAEGNAAMGGQLAGFGLQQAFSPKKPDPGEGGTNLFANSGGAPLAPNYGVGSP